MGQKYLKIAKHNLDYTKKMQQQQFLSLRGLVECDEAEEGVGKGGKELWLTLK